MKLAFHPETLFYPYDINFVMKNIHYLLLSGVLLISYACEAPKDEQVSQLIAELRSEYAPDKRVALWDIEYKNGILKGETNLPEAHQKLLESLDQQGVAYKDSINMLPDATLDGKTQALVTISVANIRSAARHSAELATQALMGTPLNVLKKEGTWYLIQTPEGYISWVDAAGISLKNAAEIQEWNETDKLISTEMLGYIYSTPDANEFVSDLTAGNILKDLGKTGSFYHVALPDGRTGYVRQTEVLPFPNWLASRELSDENLIHTAKKMMGAPYLWGGTSPKGVDCSGFTKTIYFLNGMIIPRDASQQVREGKEVDTSKNWENLEVGDLLFFGEPATNNTPERVVHVGMWIGNHSFIHSRGRVRISSFEPSNEHFDEYELNRYLRTKRIRNENSAHLWDVNRLIQ